jgi:hypothetical protein
MSALRTGTHRLCAWGWLLATVAGCQAPPDPGSASPSQAPPPAAVVGPRALTPAVDAVELDTLEFQVAGSAARTLVLSDARLAVIASRAPLRVVPRAIGSARLDGSGLPRIASVLRVRPAPSSVLQALTHPGGRITLARGDSVRVRIGYRSARFGAIGCLGAVLLDPGAGAVAQLRGEGDAQWVRGAALGTATLTARCPTEPDSARLAVDVVPPSTGAWDAYRLTAWAGSTTGGAPLVLSGTGFGADVQVAFGEVDAEVRRLTDSTVQVTVPRATAVGRVPVVVRQGGRRVTLFRQFEYLPAPTVVHFAYDFEGGVPADVGLGVGDSISAGITTERRRSGARALKFAVFGGLAGNNAALQLYYRAPNPPATDPNGLYQAFSVYIPRASFTNQYNTTTCASFERSTPCGGFKILLNRYNSTQSEDAPGWSMFSVGAADGIPAGDPLYAQYAEVAMDWAITRLPGCTPFVIPADRWVRIQLWLRRADGMGEVRYWLDGEEVARCRDPMLGSTTTTLPLDLQVGIVWTQAVAGPLTMYLDDLAAANGFIDP